MGWKLRKDKLRAETADAAPPPADPVPETKPANLAGEETAAFEEARLNPLPHQAENAPAFDTPSDLAEREPSPNANPFHLDTPEKPTFSSGAAAGVSDNPAFDPLDFAPASGLDTAPTFAADEADTAPTFGADDLAAAVDATDNGAEEAPVFGLDSVFSLETDDDAPLFTPMPSAFDPLPDAEADAFAMPMPGPAPIALGGETGGTSGAFAPYQPENEEQHGEALAIAPTGNDAYSDPELEVGAMAFDPQSSAFGTFSPEAPTAGEEIAQETTLPDFADARDTSSLAFEPSFEAPDALAGEAPPKGKDSGDEPFMDREALAAGLVTMEASTGLPRVAPFVLSGPENPAFEDDNQGPHALILRLGSLSATYPLVKPVTTIGRPDGETGTYPDVEVEMDDGVSRRHAEVRQEGESVYLVDMGSTNGTILNGELLTANQPARLMHGDRIRIGERVEIVFE